MNAWVSATCHVKYTQYLLIHAASTYWAFLIFPLVVSLVVLISKVDLPHEQNYEG